MSTSTPWGMSQQSEKIAVGIKSYDKANHGGVRVHLSVKRNALIPEYMRNANGWYEEDGEWAICAVVFSKEYNEYYSSPNSSIDIGLIAKKTLLEYYPDQYERYYNVKLVEGQSSERDKQVNAERNK